MQIPTKTPAATVSGATLKIGEYTGDGNATQTITGTGIDLTSGSWSIEIWPQTSNDWGWWRKTSEDATTYSLWTDQSGLGYSTNYITAGTNGGFTIGNGSNINSLGFVFTYRIFKEN